MTVNTNPTSNAGPAGGDFWAKWGVWVGIGALGVAVAALWLSGIFATNGRIDALYPTILQQTKDIDSIGGKIETAGAKIDTAQAGIAAAAAQNAELAKKLAALQEKQAAMIAKQEDQVQNVKDIKQAVGDLSNNITARFDQLQGRFDKINSTLPFKKTGLIEGSYVFASPELSDKYMTQLKEAGVASIRALNLDDPNTSSKIFDAWKEIPGRGNFFWLTKDASAAGAFLKASGQ
jgi:chromosome segregation ATPase